MKNKINWFTVEDLNEINQLLKPESEQRRNDYGIEDFKSVEQIITITPDIWGGRYYYVIFKY